MAEQKVTEWQIPPEETEPHRKKGWIDELIQNGDRWVRAQKSISTITDDVRLLMGGDQKDNTTESNSLQVDVRTFVETISDLKMIATLGTKADQFKDYVQAFNGGMEYVYHDSNFVAQSRKALQYAMLGRGYLWQRYSRDRYGWGKGRIEFPALGPLEVLPEQLPHDNDMQGCYAVTVIVPMPIAEAHGRFPRYREFLKPISRYDWKSYGTLGLARRLDFYDRFRFGDQDQDWDNHYCDIRYTFTRDLRINRSGYEYDMESYAPWGYKVPSVGSLIETINPFNGLPQSRIATEEDCRMYPQLRLTITSPSVPVPMRDKCGFDWHGEIPIVQYDVNDWVWSPLGWSLIRQVAGLEKASRSLLSKMQEVASVNLDPPMGYDLHSGVKREQLEKINLLKSQGYRVGVNGDPKRGLVSLLPESITVENEHFKQLEMLDAERKKNLGLTDITSMRDLKLNLSSDNVDKILENLGPIGNGIANSIGIANGKHAQMLKYNIPQYIPIAELLDWVGPDGVTIGTFDSEPNSLIPSHMPGESASTTSAYQKRQRAKWFAEKLGVTSTPQQLLNITEMQERLTYMMFLQRDAKVSTGTIMEKLGVKNYGGAKGNTEREKWQNEQIDDLNLKVKAQVALALAMKEAGIAPPDQPQGPAPGPGQGKGGGRPNTDAAPPKLEQRGTTTGNPRVIVSTSK